MFASKATLLLALAGPVMEVSPSPVRPPGTAAPKAPAAVPEAPTYHRDVARILQNNCVECHRSTGAGPFSLEDYGTAFDKRRMIGFVVEERIMPPWYAADGTGPWANDKRLSSAEYDTLLAWIEAGAPEGDPAEGPQPLQWQEGWIIGTPDELFAFAEPRVIPAGGAVDWQHVEAERVVPRDLWVKGLQILPSDPRVVHHASAEFLVPTPAPKPRASDEVMQALAPWTRRKPKRKPERWQYLFGYLPGKGPRQYQPGVARFLPAGSRIRFGMHYTPKGVATEDVTTLGLVLADEEADFLAETMYMHAPEVEIPPGETAEFSSEMRVPYDVMLRSVTPHMHLRGRTFSSEVIYPDGRVELLIEIPEWDQDWQNSYVLEEPRFLPKGSQLRIAGSFDNTSANSNNPDPTQHVRFGQQIWDEMLTMAVEWVRPRDEALRHAARSNPKPGN